MKLQVVGPGCGNCKALLERTTSAADQIGLEYELEKVEAMDEIIAMGVARTPALAVDGQVKLVGRVPSVEELVQLLEGR